MPKDTHKRFPTIEASLHSAYSNTCSMVHGGIVHGRPCWKIRAWKTLLEELRMEDHAGRIAYGRSCWRMEDHAGRHCLHGHEGESSSILNLCCYYLLKFRVPQMGYFMTARWKMCYNIHTLLNIFTGYVPWDRHICFLSQSCKHPLP